MENTLDTALYLAEQGYSTFPMNAETKIPLKSMHGFKDATTNVEQLTKWFRNTSNNIGLSLENTNLIVIDIDFNHHNNGVNGIDNFREILVKHKGDFPPDTYVEQSANGGVHYFLSVDDKSNLRTKQSAFFEQSGVDILVAGGVVIAPSVINHHSYKVLKNRCISAIKPCPNWLLSELKPKEFTSTPQLQRTGKKYTGKLLDYMVAGSQSGQRNVWLSQLAGKLFNSDATPQTVYNLLLIANSNFIDEPLEETEVNQIFRSILSREAGK